MADTKITGLTNFDSSNTPYWPPAPASDVIPIVDISDNTMAASGTTKKISINNLLSSSPTATGALTVTGLVTAGSATITGAATVGTTLGVTGVSTLASAVVTGALTSGSTTLVAHAAGYTGKVGIGTATPATNLHIINDTAATNSAVDVLTITQSSTGTAAAGLGGGVLFKSERPSGGLILNRGAIYGVSGTDPDDDGDLAFYTLTDTGPTGFTEKVRINAIGNIVMKTANTGIDFSINSEAAGMTSELLNDYEEGTWTVGLAFGGASTGITASANQGKYTKVGRKVTVTGYLGLTSKGSATGNAVITGLPFTIPNSTENYSAASLWLNVITFADFPMAFGAANTTTINLQEVTNAGVNSNLTNADFANNSEITLSFTYFV